MLRDLCRGLPVMLVLIGLVWSGSVFAAGGGRVSSGESAQIRVFMYHHIGMEEKYPSTSVSTEQFEKHLAYLQEHEYTVLTLGAALDRLYSGKNVPEKSAVITMDDGYRSIWDNALPLLEEYDFPATIFVATGYVGGENFLTWEQIAKLAATGFEIGNHSHSHSYFVNKPAGKIGDVFAADLKQSHELFRRHLGRVPRLYAYPFGEYCPEMIPILKEQGYVAATAQRSGVIFKESNPYALPRFPMNLHYADIKGFKEKIGIHALQVVEAEPKDPVVSENNPPSLRLRIKNSQLHPRGLQCFVNGKRNCRLTKEQEKSGVLKVTMRSSNQLSSRRTLYTLTGPSYDGSTWFWYSYPWVMPEEEGHQ